MDKVDVDVDSNGFDVGCGEAGRTEAEAANQLGFAALCRADDDELETQGG